MPSTVRPLCIDLAFVGLEVWIGWRYLGLALWLSLPWLGLLSFDLTTSDGVEWSRIPPDVLGEMDEELGRLDRSGPEPLAWSQAQGEALLWDLIQREKVSS